MGKKIIVLSISAVCTGSSDIVIAMDHSGSVGSANWAKSITFVKKVVEGLSIGPTETQVAIITFGAPAAVIFNLNMYDSKQSLLAAIDSLVYHGGGNDIASSIQQMRVVCFTSANGDRSTAPNIAMVLTDGQDSTNVANEVQLASHLKITFYAIGK